MPQTEVAELVGKIQAQRQIEIDYDVVESAGHFYERELDAMVEIVESYIARRFE